MIRELVVVCLMASASASAEEGPTLVAASKRSCSNAAAAWHCLAEARVDQFGQAFAASDGPTWGFTPVEIQAAYDIDPNLPSDATVALVDAFDDPTAESDLAVYRSYFGLPACTTANGCFRKVNESGDASPLPGPPPADDDWTVEISLDLAAVSAGCPHCKILLIEAGDDLNAIIPSSTIGLIFAQDTAARLGATVISNSWGSGPSGEYEGQQVLDATFFNHPGIAIFASAGDDGYGSAYPAASRNVIAVGGTTLTEDSSPRGFSETVWGGSGSGCSSYESRPTWQTNAATQCSNRAMNDLAAVADPGTGLAIYDTAYGNGGWMVVGGTSLASPLVAAIFAGSGNGSVNASFVYANASQFYDVTGGNDGSCSPGILCQAAAAWDGPTGVGTPNAQALAALAAPPPPAKGGGGCNLGDLFGGIGQLALFIPVQLVRARKHRRRATIA